MTIIVVMIMFYTALVYTQYSNYKNNMLILLRTNHKGILAVQARVDKFRREVADNHSYEEAQDFAASEQSYEHIITSRNGPSQRSIQHYDSRSIQRNFLLHYGKFLLVTIVFTVIFIAESNALLQVADDLLLKVNQSQLINRLKLRVNIASQAVYEMMLSNGTVLIENQPASEVVAQSFEDLISLREELAKLTLDQHLMSDEVLRSVLLQGDCQYTAAPFKAICEGMKKGAQQMSLIQMLIDIQSGFERTLSRYYAVNTTANNSQSLITLTLVQFQLTTFRDAASVGRLGRLVSDLISSKMKERVSNESNNTFWMRVYGSIAMGLAGGVMLWLALRDVFEAENRFKSILLNFPARLLLSNSLLKIYLLKISRGSLNFVKNLV